MLLFAPPFTCPSVARAMGRSVKANVKGSYIISQGNSLPLDVTDIASLAGFRQGWWGVGEQGCQDRI